MSECAVLTSGQTLLGQSFYHVQWITGKVAIDALFKIDFEPTLKTLLLKL